MTTQHFAALTAMLLVCSTAVSAKAQSVNAPATVAPAIVRGAPTVSVVHDPNQVVCKTRGEPGHLGSRRLCGTRAQWDQLARDGADALIKVQNASGFNANPMDNGMSRMGGTGSGH